MDSVVLVDHTCLPVNTNAWAAANKLSSRIDVIRRSIPIAWLCAIVATQSQAAAESTVTRTCSCRLGRPKEIWQSVIEKGGFYWYLTGTLNASALAYWELRAGFFCIDSV